MRTAWYKSAYKAFWGGPAFRVVSEGGAAGLGFDAGVEGVHARG